MAKQKTYYTINKKKVETFRSRKELDVLREERDYEIYDSRVEAEAKAAGEINLKWIVTNTVITLSYKGKKKQIRRTAGNYKDVLAMIKDKKLAKLEELFDAKTKLKKELKMDISEKGAVKKGNTVLPEGLVSKFVDMTSQGKLGMKAAKAFFDKVSKNPKEGILEELVAFLQHNHMLFTEDGNIIGYKGIRHDWLDAHSQKFVNKPGKVIMMDRNEVDDNPNQTCSRGLHVGSFSYASDFCTKTVEVLVDPRDVVSVPVDYNGQKMRVCKYKVLKEISAPRFYNSCVVKA